MASSSASRVRAPSRRSQVFSAGFRLLNRCEIWRIRGQKEELAPSGDDGLAGTLPFVDTQIVQHHHLAWLQAGSEYLLHRGFKGPRIRQISRRMGRRPHPNPSAAIMDAPSVQTVKAVLSWYACCSGVHDERDRPDVNVPACSPQQRRPAYGYHPAVP